MNKEWTKRKGERERKKKRKKGSEKSNNNNNNKNTCKQKFCNVYKIAGIADGRLSLNFQLESSFLPSFEASRLAKHKMILQISHIKMHDADSVSETNFYDAQRPVKRECYF